MTWGPFGTEADFLDAWRGEYGPDWEAEAEALADEQGWEIQEEADPAEEEREAAEAAELDSAMRRDAWLNELSERTAALEEKLGRTFTMKEIDALADDALASNGPPDPEARYEEVIGRSLSDPDDAHQIMVETMEEDQAENSEPKEKPELPAEPDLSNDEERRAAIVADMEAVEAGELAA